MEETAIEIVLRDGDPYGIRTAVTSVSTIKAIAFPRAQFSNVKNEYKELSHAGVYLLLGRDIDDNNCKVAYVGESENVAERLQHHIGNKKDEKQYWADTIALVSIDGSVNKQHVTHIEAKLIAIANENIYWNLPNKKLKEKKGTLTKSDEIKVNKFIDQAKILTGALGSDLFKPTSGNLVLDHSSIDSVSEYLDSPEFYFAGAGFDAKAIVSGTSGDWIVKAASEAKLEPSGKIPNGAKKLRDQLKAAGKLVELDGKLIFKEDCLFPTASAAANVVCGRAANGRIEWKLADGTTYADWEAKESENVEDSAMEYDQIITDKGKGSLPRILDTINCFRRRYNTWPTNLLVDKEISQALQQDNLTPAGWQALAKKLEIKYSVRGTVIAEDDKGNSFEYDANHLVPEDKSNSADYWIWGCEVWPRSV